MKQKHWQVRLALSLVILLSLSCAQKSTTIDKTVTPYVAGTSAVIGKVYLDPVCQASAVTITAVMNNQTVYRVDVNPNASYELQLQPGQYYVKGETANGCIDQKMVQVIQSQVQELNLSLKLSGYATNPYPTGTPISYPSYPTYPNTGTYPCAWNMYGCQGYYYPGQGEMVAGKPNIYLSGPEGTKFNLKMKIANGSNLLIATPIHGLEGWSGVLKKDKIFTENVSQDYLYYDLRIKTDSLQNKSGFCVKQSELIFQMAMYLEKSGFKANEVSDFKSYWTKVMPPADSYCVYPQESKEIDPIAQYQVEPQVSRVLRVWFVVIPQVQLAMKKELRQIASEKVKNLPEKLSMWFKTPEKKQEQSKKIVIQERNVASTLLEIREWGVCFLATPK